MTAPRAALTQFLDARFMAKLDTLDVMSRKVLQGKLRGERRSKRRGQSAEFADHRPYVAGDDTRFVDWNIYGRLDQLFLKLFLEEQDLCLHILVDTSASTASGEPRKDLALKRLAAALAYVGLVNNNRVTVAAFADGLVGRLADMRGRAYLPQLAEFLLALSPTGLSRFEKAAAHLTADRRGSGVTVVLSDFFFKEGYEAGLKRLVSDRYELCAVQIISPQERAPELAGDLKLVDVEDGDHAEVTISRALLEYYKRNLAAYAADLKQFCERRGALYVFTDSAYPVDRLVLENLRRGRLVG